MFFEWLIDLPFPTGSAWFIVLDIVLERECCNVCFVYRGSGHG